MNEDLCRKLLVIISMSSVRRRSDSTSVDHLTGAVIKDNGVFVEKLLIF